MPVCRVIGPLEAYSDEVTAVPIPGIFLVGRNEEVGLLQWRWEQSKEGPEQVVLISGEASIGKSTLVQTIRAHVGREEATWITCRCSPYHTNSVLYPIIQHLPWALRWQWDDPATVKLNKLDQALAGGHEALRLAHELAHPYTLVMSLYGVAVLHWLRREVQAAHERNEPLLVHAQEQDFPTWIAWGMALRGWILATQGQAERGMAQVRHVLSLEHAASVPLWPFALVRAEVYRVSGYAGEGLRLLAEALAVVDKTDVRDFEAEIYRLQGELLLAQSVDNYAEAATCLSRALALARRQQAKAWELRAAMSLSRLWQQQSKQEDARELLAAVYNWFTEGFETADLQEARALLDALAS